MLNRMRKNLILLPFMVLFCAAFGMAQVANLSVSGISFGNIVVNSTSTRGLTITNSGTSDLIISGIATTTDYQWSNCGNTTLAPSNTCQVTVSFTPTTTGTVSGSVTITDNASDSPQVVNLSGNGVSPVTLSTANLTFQNQAQGTTSPARGITLYNNQSVPLNITSITTSGDFAASGCPSPVGAHSNCVISVTFTPTALGLLSGTMTISDDASNSPQTANLSGLGVQPVTFSPSGTILFGNQVVNTTSSAKTVTLTNNQSVPLNISSVTTTGDYSASGCPSSLGANSSCSINITFTPTAIGSRTGTLTVADDASTSPQTLSLSGTGIFNVYLSPTSLLFSSTSVGSTSAAQTATLTNNQSTSLTVNSVTTTGPFAATSCPATIAPGGSCVISVTFSPTAAGKFPGTLTVVDSASSSPQTASLKGSAVAATLTSITVAPANPSIAAGTTQQFTATGNYDNGTTQDLTSSVTWTSSTTSAATINSAGLATAVAVGASTITATSGSVSGSTVLTVTSPTLVSISVTPADFIIAPSATQQFTATGTYTDGNTKNLTSSVAWNSASTGVATINSAGLATGVAAGNTTISATSGSVTGSTILTVGTAPTPSSITLTPASPSVPLGTTEQFTATGAYSDGSTKTLTSADVTWGAGGVAGGNSTVGTISSSGLYTAPSTAPNPAQVTVTATSISSSSISGSTTLTVSQVAVNVSPTSVQVSSGATQQFTATVTGASNTAVTWSVGGVVGGNLTVGTISTDGLYTAPTTIPNPAQVTITATSVADGVTSSSATVTVTQAISVAISPSGSQTVRMDRTLQFSATVTGTTNTNVTWNVGGVAGGNIIVGTISNAGLYTPPLVLPNPTLTSVTATSVADPTKSSSAAVTVGPPGGVSVRVSPVTAWVEIGNTEQFSSVVNGTTNTAVTWSVNGTAGGDSTDGTISSTGLYTPPSSVPSSPQVTITATSNADPTRSATGTVTVATGPFAATPLIDFAPGQLYAGQLSGLLYDGSNSIPTIQDSAGLTAASQIQPLDTNGNPDPNGKVVLISMGVSATADEWCDGSPNSSCTSYSFTGQAAASSSVNHTTLSIVNGATAGANATVWACPYGNCPANSPYTNQYDRVRDNVLAPAGLTEAQVQVVWLQEATPSPTWYPSMDDPSADAYRFEYWLGQDLRALKMRWPNVKEVFISSRIYAGYATTMQNPEPYAYEYGFGVKALINAQIVQRETGTIDPLAGDLLTEVPWVAWGPYVWGSGSNNPPGSMALSWTPEDFTSDGTHPSPSGVNKVGTALLNYFLNSPYTAWFRSQ